MSPRSGFEEARRRRKKGRGRVSVSLQRSRPRRRLKREKRSSFYVVMNRSSRTVRWWLAGWVGGARCRSRDVVVRIPLLLRCNLRTSRPSVHTLLSPPPLHRPPPPPPPPPSSLNRRSAALESDLVLNPLVCNRNMSNHPSTSPL